MTDTVGVVASVTRAAGTGDLATTRSGTCEARLTSIDLLDHEGKVVRSLAGHP